MRIGILCAIPKEIHFFDLLPDSAQLVGGRTFFKSKHSSHDLVVVECGIGKVNAAMVSTLLVKVFDCEMLIFSGVADDQPLFLSDSTGPTAGRDR